MIGIYLKLYGPDVKGEAERKGYEEQIELTSHSWGVGNGGSTHSGGGSSASVPIVQDMSCTLNNGKASSKLMMHSLKGTHFTKAEISMLKSTGENTHQLFQKYTLEDLIITNYQQSGMGGGDALPSESMTLNFAKVTHEYFQQKKDGGLEAVGAETFDVKKGEALT